ncbi:MAG TPA: glycosyltransferase family 1 protein [Pyrinomonadaceae bacterium]|jgi:glycosyltransferase involved in cell wall biosynthesis|nr:glycosyltransferase family 1 protein [Pyrinomonadaceae bacterium]
MYLGIDGLPLTAAKTGVGHYTSELAIALANLAASNQIEIVYPSTYPTIAHAEQKSAPLPSNLKLKRVAVGTLGKHWWSIGLPRYARRNKLELFHGTNYDIPLWRRCATVLTIHDLSQLLHAETHEKRSVRRARRRLPHMARLADAIITPTECVRNDVRRLLGVVPEKIFAIPEAARTCFRPLVFEETAVTRSRLGIGDNFLLSVGTLEPRKNLSVLVNAFAEVTSARSQSSTQLVIAGGRGWLSGPLFDAIEKSPVRDRIVLTDYLHDDELRALYSGCRAFVYPSIHEGFGLPPMEAMACGAPVVASRIPALEETTGGAALLFDPGSVHELTRSVLEVLDNENKRRELSAAGLRRAADFTWKKTAEATLSVYEEALRRFQKVGAGASPPS